MADHNPNGATLDDTREVMRMRKQRFEAWKRGNRNQNLKPNDEVKAWYDNMSSPYDDNQ